MGTTSALTQPRDKVLDYIEAILVHSYTKKDAYLAFIDSSCKNPYPAIARLEGKKEYQEILAVVTSDENYKFLAKTQRVKNKFLTLIEKNIDTADGVLDDVKKGTLRDKSAAVRLANETVQAMAVVSGAGGAATQPGVPKLDKSGVIS